VQALKEPPTVTAIIDGPVPGLDGFYAFDEVRKLSQRAASAVCGAQMRLGLQTYPRPVAIAECVVILESGTAVIAGAVASTMREAVDELMMRLHRRLRQMPSE
jgi:ribosome-associated translation inhibitor RaiA